MRFQYNIFHSLLPVSLGLFLLGCSNSTNGLNSSRPSGILSTISGAISTASSSMTQTGIALPSVLRANQSNGVKSFAVTVDDLCDENANPIDSGSFMSNSDARFPARLFYCKIAKNTSSPDSIPGAFVFLEQLSCALENAGIQFDGVSRDITVDLTAGGCFSEEDREEMGDSIDMTYTASRPASFNSNFDAGIILTVPSFGTFSLATRVSGSIAEFIAFEDQSAITANKNGAYQGSIDTSSGEIRFEGRHDRFNCSESGGSCGWSRHDRIYLKCESLTASGNCTNLESIQGAATEIYSPSNGNSGKGATISGALATGIKARFFQSNPSDFNNPSGWSEVTNTACYTATADDADCGSNTGLALPSSGSWTFPLFTGHTANSSWYSVSTPLTFTSIDMTRDVP